MANDRLLSFIFQQNSLKNRFTITEKTSLLIKFFCVQELLQFQHLDAPLGKLIY